MSNPTPSPVPQGYDPFKQQFTLIGGDGSPIQADMDSVDWLRKYGSRLGINFGSQVGASVMLLLLLLLLTRRERMKSAIFISNTFCLAVNTIRSILQCLYLSGNYRNIYSLLANDASHDRWTDRANTVASNTITLVLVISIMISLSMQVWVVCKTASTVQRIVVTGLTSALGLIAIGYRFAVTVLSNIAAMNGGTMEPYQWLLDQMTIMQAVSIWSYCAIFTFKLGYALVQRRRLGMTQFGPMQIVFIMGAQTMFIPAMFSVLQIYQGSDGVPEIGSQTPTVVCVFLPLSAIWASIVANDTFIPGRGGDAVPRLFRGHFGSTARSAPSTTRFGNSGTFGNYGSTIGGTTVKDKDPDSPITPTGKHDRDLEGGIYVDHQWSIEMASSSKAHDRV